MRAQTEAAVRDADVALFLIDAREGLTPLDEEIARWLRTGATPVIVAANKAEGRGGEAGRLEAYALGLGDPIAISAEHGEGVVDLFEALRPLVEKEGPPPAAPLEGGEEEVGGPLKLAIGGGPRRQVDLGNRMLGKSDDHRPRGTHGRAVSSSGLAPPDEAPGCGWSTPGDAQRPR